MLVSLFFVRGDCHSTFCVFQHSKVVVIDMTNPMLKFRLTNISLFFFLMDARHI